MDFLENIIIGIIGGIFSSIVVSRLFLIESQYREELQKVESYLVSLGYLNGRLDAIIEMEEIIHDGKKGVAKKNYTETTQELAGEECLKRDSSQDPKNLALLSKELDLNIDENELRSIKNKAIEFKNAIFLGFVYDSRLDKIRREIEKMYDAIIDINRFTLDEFRLLSKRMKNISRDYNKIYAKRNRTIVSRVIRDKLMIALFILFIILIAFEIVLKLISICR